MHKRLALPFSLCLAALPGPLCVLTQMSFTPSLFFIIIIFIIFTIFIIIIIITSLDREQRLGGGGKESHSLAYRD